jgi:hypothetical protein
LAAEEHANLGVELDVVENDHLVLPLLAAQSDTATVTIKASLKHGGKHRNNLPIRPVTAVVVVCEKENTLVRCKPELVHKSTLPLYSILSLDTVQALEISAETVEMRSSATKSTLQPDKMIAMIYRNYLATTLASLTYFFGSGARLILQCHDRCLIYSNTSKVESYNMLLTTALTLIFRDRGNICLHRICRPRIGAIL